jgi:hypothetical protein
MICLACSERDFAQRWPARSAILRTARSNNLDPAQPSKPVKEGRTDTREVRTSSRGSSG